MRADRERYFRATVLTVTQEGEILVVGYFGFSSSKEFHQFSIGILRPRPFSCCQDAFHIRWLCFVECSERHDATIVIDVGA